jgi:hypothetical protein
LYFQSLVVLVLTQLWVFWVWLWTCTFFCDILVSF